MVLVSHHSQTLRTYTQKTNTNQMKQNHERESSSSSSLYLFFMLELRNLLKSKHNTIYNMIIGRINNFQHLISKVLIFNIQDLTHTKLLYIHQQHPRRGLANLDQGNRDMREEGFKGKQQTHQKKSQHHEQQNQNYLICWIQQK